MTPIYSLENLEKRYGDRTVLHIRHLDLYPERLYALTGPNGAGKSTLIHLLALLEKPSEGTLSFGGHTLGKEDQAGSDLRRQVTLVHQAPYLFSGSVEHNIALGLRMRGISGKTMNFRISEALDSVGLQGFERRNGRELSGGEIQRVALARALALKPRVLLLDEPTSNIDRTSIAAMEGIIAELPSQRVTVILSSHDPQQPQRLGCEVIQLAGGGLVHDFRSTSESMPKERFQYAYEV